MSPMAPTKERTNLTQRVLMSKLCIDQFSLEINRLEINVQSGKEALAKLNFPA